jgi:hypothetical protein
MRRESARRKVRLFPKIVASTFAVLLLCLASGCSSSKLSAGASVNDIVIKGSYTYSMSGGFFGSNGATTYYQRNGSFVADGQGRILSGSDDLLENGTLVTSPITGVYQVAGDGTGLMLLTIGSTQLQWAFSVTSNSEFTVLEFDSFASGMGGAFLQDPGSSTQMPNGTFAFRTQSFQLTNASEPSSSTVGSITLNNGSLSGNEDVLRSGSLSSLTVTGTVTTPDSTGKGSITLNDSGGVSSTYSYYVIDANTINLMQTGFANIGSGRMRTQLGGPFNNASLSNQFVLTGSGDTGSSIFGVVSVGVISSDGNGNITSGSYDSVLNGSTITNSTLAGTYDVAANGRATMNLTSSNGGSVSEIVWLVSSTQAFYLVNDPSAPQVGTLDQQQGSNFSNSSLNGQFAFSMYGHDSQTLSAIDRVGVANFDGNNTLTLNNYFVNRSGTRLETSNSGIPYSVSSNGRVTASIDGVTTDLVMYLISNGSGYLILEDPNSEVAGGMTQQSLQ